MINSDSYWNKRFQEDWESFQGPSQSRFFARLAIEHLPSWFIEQLQRHSYTLADWGCAQGDGTDVWASYMDASKIVGVDFSSMAVSVAAKRYPAIRFFHEDWLQEHLPESNLFDVVFSSNTLEHFHRPFSVLDILSARATKAIVLALPYREMDRHPEHFYSFLPDNIPLHISNGFRLVWSRIVDCRIINNALWDGEQVILIYARTDWFDGLALNLRHSIVEQTSFDAELLHLKNHQSARESSLQQELDEHVEQVTLLHRLLSERDEQVVSLGQRIAERDAQLDSFRQSLAESQVQLSTLTSELARVQTQIKNHQSARESSLQQELDEYVEQVTLLHRLLSERDEQAVSLGQRIAERDAQLDSFRQSLAESQVQQSTLTSELARVQTQMMNLSDEIFSFNRRPLRHAFRKTAFGLARRIFRSLPLANALKYRLRELFFLMTRSLRQSGQSHMITAGPIACAHVTTAPISVPSQCGLRDVFVFAVIDWHFRMQRPQHMARSLSEQGHRVFYFSNHFVDTDEPGYELERLPGTAVIYQIKLHVCGAPVIYFDAPSPSAREMLTLSMKKFMLDFVSLSSYSIIQHAYWYPLVQQLPNSYKVYDCMDHHEGFGDVPNGLVELENTMLSSVDLVSVTSSWLEDFARKYNKNISLVRNAAEYTYFAVTPQSIYRDDQGRRIIGYYGAIAEWFDLEIIRSMSHMYADCLILLVGNDTVNAKKQLAELSNVVLTGEVPYDKLPYYLYAFDVCLLPFKIIPLTLATNPVKVYEYLSAGKPVVCVNLPEIEQFGDLVWRASSSSEFVEFVGEALLESSDGAKEKKKARQLFASEQTWSHRGLELLTALNGLSMPRISVIVLTYNNLELTRACLESVLQRSEYPNLELIVVDNASSDQTPAYLKDLERHHPEIRVVLNDLNSGFAAGNNLGLSIATGDYLVLLNNDTVVTRGWVLTLLRHFQNDSSLGIVGPVTNNIGNEARIETTYHDTQEMPAEIIHYTLAHMGQTCPIRTAAFFCAMFPRSVYEHCGPICEDYGRGFFEDDDYCRRVEAMGKRIVCADDVFVHHHLSASFNQLKSSDKEQLFLRNKQIYENKWGPWIPHSYRKA